MNRRSSRLDGLVATPPPRRGVAGAILSLALLACAPETPPKPDAPARPQGAPAATAEASARWTPEVAAVLSFAGDRGAFADAKAPDAIPEASRGMVRVSLLDGPAPPPGTVWVGNFRNREADGAVALSTVPRDAFEELALGQGLSSAVELPPGLQPPEHVATQHGDVIVYKTSWCGVCKKLESYLQRKGVAYVAKDIEADREAAAELQAKAQAKGVRTGSVPIVDVRGELLVGFDRARLEQLL
ncbi:MAG: glutaredoxin family protein [Nannocystaceae bacterium]|nr:glutaredoxin family protein [Nannocystaceae bacterium]